MDAKLFRLPTQPDFYQSIQSASPVNKIHKAPHIIPAVDSRFPGWAGPMSDGRLVTDYNPQCTKNIPVGKQFPTTLWMQRNADDIIQYSRSRSAIDTGSIFPFDSTVVPPPSSKVSCTRSECKMVSTGINGGIGLARNEETVPELFGTFNSDTLFPTKEQVQNVRGTVNYEGGRNSLRGTRN
jgi:hypothetical protein